MTTTERRAYYDGYEQHRSWRGFENHFAHWAVIVLVESASFRLRARIGDPDLALAWLGALLAAETCPSPRGRQAVPTGGR